MFDFRSWLSNIRLYTGNSLKRVSLPTFFTKGDSTKKRNILTVRNGSVMKEILFDSKVFVNRQKPYRKPFKKKVPKKNGCKKLLEKNFHHAFQIQND